MRRAILEWSLALLVVNQLAIPVATSLGNTAYFSGSTDPYVKIPAKEIASRSRLPKEFTARDYLNLGNSIVQQYSHVNELCKPMSDRTFTVYEELTSANERDDLKEKVRLAIEYPDGTTGYHVWLQVFENNDWVNYEPLQGTKKLDIGQVQQYSAQTRDAKAELEQPATPSFYSNPGTTIVKPGIDAFLGKVGYVAYALNPPKPAKLGELASR